MNIINQLNKLKELYSDGKNIIEYIKNNTGSNGNSTDAILISYDLQAGNYIKFANENADYIEKYTSTIAKTIDQLGNFDSIIEVGVGEATTLANVALRMKNKPKNYFGFDISWSRIKYAQTYVQSKNISCCHLFTGDLFQIPLADNSIDVVYTSHSIEPNGGKEKEALEELYRISKKYLVLLEPSYEFATDEGKARMERLGYIKNLAGIARELNYDIIEHRLFDYCANPLNPTGLLIVKKKESSTATEKILPFICPITKAPLEEIRGSYFSNDSLLCYPIIDNVPCLLSNNAIIATHYKNFNN
ncbi:MAG: class I SAM-dependent methyltransferase [Cytophagaceae bacterium]